MASKNPATGSTEAQQVAHAPAVVRRIGTVTLARRLVDQPEIGAFSATILLFIIMSIASPYFLGRHNLVGVADSVSADGIIAAVSTLVLIMGGIDLSAVGVMGITSIAVGLAANDNWPIVGILALTAGIGVVAGLVNGLLIAYARINPFVVTLATWFIATGAAYVVSSGQGWSISNPAFLAIAQTVVAFGIPSSTIIMLGVFAVAWYFARFTRFGLHAYAVGGDESSARLSGVGVSSIRLIVYIASALSGALAGLVLTARTQASVPYNSTGNDLLLILAAIIVGGVPLSGGRGSPLGTLAGIYLIALINNALVLLQISSFYQPIVTGVILLLAVGVDEVRRRRWREA